MSSEGGNIAWEAPTIVPMKATAAGTLIGPSADALSVRNLSAFPIRVKTMDVQAVDPFHLVADADKSSGENDFQMSVNGVAAAPSVELVDDGAWAMGYAGNADGTDALPLTLSGAKIARVTADLSQAKKAATISWTVEPTTKDVKQPGTTVQAAIAKDAKDWALDDQQAVAEDISANGEASPVYAKAKAAMETGTTWKVKLANGAALEYRIVGINHDDLADGTGKSGLTFEATNNAVGNAGVWCMNTMHTNAGGWEKSFLRQQLNSGYLWSLLPAEIQSKVKGVSKMTDNKGGGSAGIPSVTTDKVFILSVTEIWGGNLSEGAQYEYYKSSSRPYRFRYSHWSRSVCQSSSSSFRYIEARGTSYYENAACEGGVFPAWCF